MEIDADALAGLERLGTPVWVVDVPRAAVIWRSARAEGLVLSAADRAGAPAEGSAAGADLLAGLFATRFGAAPDGRPGAAPLTARLSDAAGGERCFRFRALPWRELLGHARVAVEGLAEARPAPVPGIDALLAQSAGVLRASAEGAPLETLLERIVAMVESALPESFGSVLLLSPDGRHVAVSVGPTLPPAYHAAIRDLEIGPATGSCGTAMHEGRRIIVEDIATHPYWEGYRDIVLPLGLRACWSEPIRLPEGRVVGSFAIYGHRPRAPDATQLRVIEAAGNLASIALEADRSRRAARAATDRLRESEARLRSLLEASPSIISLKDTDGRFRSVNGAFCRTYGTTPEAVLGRTAEEVFGPETARRFAADERGLGPARPAVSHRIEDPAVPGLTLETTKFLVRDAEGRVEGIGAVALDVTGQRRREREIVLLSERLALAVEASGAGVYDCDLATGRLVCDARMTEIFGRPPGVAGQPCDPEPWLARVVEADRPGVRRALAGTEGDPARHFTFRVLRPEGAVRHVRASQRLVREGGRPARLVGVTMDVTADVLMAETLAERSREAEAASAAKSQFLASVSHELRTPLNGVLGCAQLLACSALEPAQRAQVEVIETSGQALLDLIEDLLDIGRIESGAARLEPVPLALADLAETTIAMLRPMAESRGLALRLEIEPDLADRRMGDARRLRQILLNLLGNAVKFTEEGEVRLSLAHRAGEVVRFSVSDTGPGVPPELRAWVFERFTRIETGGRAPQPGTGLGLAIVRDLVALMGGEIALGRSEGGGARFDLDLPMPRAGAEAPRVARTGG